MKRAASRYTNENITNEDTRRNMAEETEFGPRKTIIVLAIVAGCFAILWPKIFYPMFSAPSSTIHKPNDGPACCDLIFESDVNAVDIMQEMCKNILRHHQVDPRVRDALKLNKLTPQSASFCREKVLARCGIDLSTFLAEKERLGKTYKQVLEEIRSFNSSLCLKRQFGVPLSQLGTPHLIRYHILMPHSPMRQERRVPPHAGGLHPAMLQRGRAIPASHIVPKVNGRPDRVVIEKLRPPMGAAGRAVPTPSANNSMGIIMPLYTLGIFIFFLYTIAKVMRKNSDNEIYAEYQNPAAEREFRNKVFDPELLTSAITGAPCYRNGRSSSPVKPIPTMEELEEQAAGCIEIDQLRQRLVDTEAAMERIAIQMGSLSRSVVHNINPHQDTQLQSECCPEASCCGRNWNAVEDPEDSSAKVKIMGMEMTACCEGGQKVSRPTTPIITQTHAERECTPPKPIYLEGALPPQCELLVTDSETQAENSEDDTEAPVVLSGKMTLSLISHDQNTADTEESSLELEEDHEETEDKSPVESREELKMNRGSSDKSRMMEDPAESEVESEVEEDEEEDVEDGDAENESSEEEDEDEEEEEEEERIINKEREKRDCSKISCTEIKKEDENSEKKIITSTTKVSSAEEDDDEEEEEEDEEEEEEEDEDEDEDEKENADHKESVHLNEEEQTEEDEEDDEEKEDNSYHNESMDSNREENSKEETEEEEEESEESDDEISEGKS